MAVILVFALPGCGRSSGTSDAAKAHSKSEAGTTAAKSETRPDYPVPQAPPQKGPLKKLVVRDIKVGKGSMAHWGDEVTVRYVGLVYETGEVFVRHWHGVPPLVFKLDGSTFGVGFQKGIEGMRVGGRRELLIPKHLLFEDDDVAYIVELRRVDHKVK